MAIEYKAWLAATGKPPTEANALIWKKTHGAALGLYNPDGTPKAPAPAAPAPAPAPAQPAAAATPAPTPYNPPAWDPNYRDAEALSALSLNNAKYDTQRLNAQNAYATWLNQTYGDGAATAVKDATGKITGYNYDLTKRGGKFLDIARNRDEGLERTVNTSAARGMLRSGNRIENEGKVRSAALREETGIENARQTAQGDMDAAVTGAETDRAFNENQIVTDANRRRTSQYNAQYGMGS